MARALAVHRLVGVPDSCPNDCLSCAEGVEQGGLSLGPRATAKSCMQALLPHGPTCPAVHVQPEASRLQIKRR